MKKKKRTEKENSIRVHIMNQKEGANFKRLSMALDMILSEKDIINYLNKNLETSPLLENEVFVNKT
jgi:hypothetical protein